MKKKKKSFIKRNSKRILILFFLVMVLFLVFLVGYSICFGDNRVDLNKNIKNSKDTISISYVGDLILLKDQVTNSYDDDTKKYDFSYMFERVKPYFNDSDYTIGVFEGPISNEKMGYSTSNYGDGEKIYLGFPEEFALAVRNSGIDLVTTANNHLMDKGKEGVYNTIDYLDKIGLDQVGSYKSNIDKNEIKIVEVRGIKIAVLAYTMGSNYYDSSYFMEEEPGITSLIVSEKSPYFEKVKTLVKEDFDKALEADADLIIVMPHMGSQFIHETNEFQDLWNEIFVSYGADIILGDHSHATQPVEFIGDTLVVNSPGNFANSYVKDDGDATSIVEFYINKNTKEVEGASVVPMYTKEIEDGKYQAVPIYDIYTDEELYEEFSEEELERVSEVQEIVTSSMIGKEVDITQIQERYFVFKDDSNNNFVVGDALDDSSLKSLLDEASSVTFIGDSVTHGTKNGLRGWYEPLMELYPDIEVNNISDGSYTTRKMISNFGSLIEESDSDVYFIALGTNDVRYRDNKICSMTAEEYIKNIDKIVSMTRDDAQIVLIAPWTSLANDLNSALSYNKKTTMIKEYADALEEYANLHDYIYIDANKYINLFLENHNAFDYLLDYIHPNSGKGIELYSYAVLRSSPIN